MRSAHACMRLPFLYMTLPLGVLVLAGPSGCGPASAGDPANVDSRAGMAGPSPSEQAPVSGSVPTTPAASPAPVASGRAPAGHGEARPAEPRVVPAWIGNDLTSPDVQVRLQALDRWVQQGRTDAVAPLMVAVNDPDERVRERALQLIEQDWRAEPDAQGKKNP